MIPTAPTACLEAINRLKWPPPVPLLCVYKKVFKQQYTSCVKVGTGGNLSLSREYHKKLFGPLFYTWWNCPLRNAFFDQLHEVDNDMVRHILSNGQDAFV